MKKIIKNTICTSIIAAALCAQSVKAQNTFPATGSVGIGTTTPNAKALLDVTSTTKGVLLPRMTKAQRDAITSPVMGLLIYQTNLTPGFYSYNGTAWVAVTSASANKTLGNLSPTTAVNVSLLPASSFLLDLGSASLNWRDIYASGNVAIGLGTPPAAKLHAIGVTSDGIRGQTLLSDGNGIYGWANTGASCYAMWGYNASTTGGYAGYFNGAVTVTGVFNNPSDARLKENIKPVENALSLITQLEAKTYNFKAEYAKMNLPKGSQYGLIAQEVEKVIPNLVVTNYDKSMDESHPFQYKGINYLGLIPILTQAINEQQKEIILKDAKIDQLVKDNAEMKTRMDMFEKSLSQCCSNFKEASGNGQLSSNTDAARLEQNNPNPFNQSSVIKFYIPSIFHTAELVITNLAGVTMKSIKIEKAGVSEVTINANELAAGSYMYSLIVDGNKAISKKMELTK
ncbi:MAG: tail fiber domain-containing protein [Bacteroidia bacterium]